MRPYCLRRPYSWPAGPALECHAGLAVDILRSEGRSPDATGSIFRTNRSNATSFNLPAQLAHARTPAQGTSGSNGLSIDDLQALHRTLILSEALVYSPITSILSIDPGQLRPEFFGGHPTANPVRNDRYTAKSQEREYIGYLYAINVFSYTDYSPKKLENLFTSKLKAIGLQPFDRPGNQKAFSLHLDEGEKLKANLYSFNYTKQDSEEYCRKYAYLWRSDMLSERTKSIRDMEVVSKNAPSSVAGTLPGRE